MRNLEVSQPWFDYIIRGIKKVEGRKLSEKWKDIKEDEIIAINNISFKVIKVNIYKSLEEYLLSEGISNCLPGIDNLEDAVKIYKQWNTDKELEMYKFMGIHIERL